MLIGRSFTVNYGSARINESQVLDEQHLDLLPALE